MSNDFANIKSKTKIYFYILSILFIITFLIWISIFYRYKENSFKLVFFDVGQGDAIYMRTFSGQDVLIDGGSDSSVLAKVGETMPFYDKKIELVILTHPDKDHIAGIVDVLKRYEVDRILYTGVKSDSSFYQEFINLVKNKNINIEYTMCGQRIDFGQNLYFDVLNPDKDYKGKKVSNTNDTSIAGRLFYGNNSIFLTGDMGEKIESNLLEKDVYLKSDILKIGHHGSKNSTSQDFIDAVNPDNAIISVGAKNSFGHPTQEILNRLSGINVYRTDKDGNIEVIIKNDMLNIK